LIAQQNAFEVARSAQFVSVGSHQNTNQVLAATADGDHDDIDAEVAIEKR
jgi:hypothetical protein